MYAITLHQPWATLIALGIKTAETRSWPAPERLLGQTIAIHAARRMVRRPDDRIERALRDRLGRGLAEGYSHRCGGGHRHTGRHAPGGLRGCNDCPAAHDVGIEMGCAVGVARTLIDPWGDFSAGRWLWFLTDVVALSEPIPAVGHQSIRHWIENGDVS